MHSPSNLRSYPVSTEPAPLSQISSVLGSVSLRWSASWNALLPGLLAATGLIGCTVVAFQLHQPLSSAGFVYLIFVVLAAVYGGFWQATLVSILAVGCLDYFFEEPIFSFTIGRVSNWVQLSAFVFTAMVVSTLSNRAHLRELEAVAERRDTAKLYQIARRILLIDPTGDPGNQVAALILEIFELRAVVLFDALSATVYECCRGLAQQERQATIERTRNSYLLATDQLDASAQSWFGVLRLGVRSVGSLALCGANISPLVATAISSLAAISLERARMLDQQCQAEAARQAEQLRTAVLDSLAHKFGTPLTVIRTATSGLPAAGELSELQRELVSLIDQEASKLHELSSRLVRTPKLDSKEFDAQPEPLLFSRLIKDAIQELDQEAQRVRFRVTAPPAEPPIFADRELILTALAQLIDNALKYSTPGSQIDVAIADSASAVVLKMRTKGLVLSPADRERIFERFYRASGSHEYAAGTGLGLSIVKAIVADHDGTVWADSEAGYGTAFSLALPHLAQGACCEQ